MKKLLLLATLFSSLAFVSNVHADKVVGGFKVPRDREAELALTVQETGVSVYTSSFSASTGGVVGPIMIFGVLTSTSNGNGTSLYGGGAFVLLWATNTPTNNLGGFAGGAVEYLVPPIAISSGAYNTFVVFDPPIVSTEGVAMYVTSASCNASFFYRYLSTAGAGSVGGENLYIPVDDNDVKAHDPAFYGVEAASRAVAGGRIGADGTDTLDYNNGDVVVYGSSLTDPTGAKWLWYGWVAGTSTVVLGGADAGAAGGNYLITGDSATAIGTPTVPFLPRLVYPTFPVEARTVNYANSGTNPRTLSYRWPWPLIFKNGVRVQRIFTNGSRDSFRMLGRPATQLRHP